MSSITKPETKTKAELELEQSLDTDVSSHSNSSNSTTTTNTNTNTNTHRYMMYGDTVIGLWWCIAVPLHGKDLWELDANDPNLPGARIVYSALVMALVLTVCSIATHRLLFSRLAFFANVFAMSVTNLYDFPFPGECAITPMMVGGTVIGVLANASLSFSEQMLRLPVYFAAGSYVCIHSPYCSYTEDTRPILGGTVLLEMTVLCIVEFGGVRKMLKHLQINSLEFNVAALARIVLACLFLHHVASTLLQLGGNYPHHNHNHNPNHNHNDTTDDPSYATQNSNSVVESFSVLVKAGVVACVGVAATGAFQDEINSKERAERKAKEESMMAKAMADSMMVLTHELRTPLQGIMGAASMLLQNNTTKTTITTTTTTTADNKENDTDNENDNDESLSLIMASSGLLLNLINNMLDVKRVAEGMMEEFPLTLFPAADPIRDSIGFCLPLASISNVNVVVDYGVGYGTPSTEHAVVRSNALRMQQVLINLISNAIKYTNHQDGDTESTITVSLRVTTVEDVDWRMLRALASSREGVGTPSRNDSGKGGSNKNSSDTGTSNSNSATPTSANDKWSEKAGSDKMLLFGVSDCGPGIDHVQANRLFRRFGRLDKAPKRTLGSEHGKVGQPSGTGLGLHLCQMFVQRMDGQIWATNNQDSPGATFFFCLPLGLELKALPERIPGRTPSHKSRNSRRPGTKSNSNHTQGRNLKKRNTPPCTGGSWRARLGRGRNHNQAIEQKGVVAIGKSSSDNNSNINSNTKIHDKPSSQIDSACVSDDDKSYESSDTNDGISVYQRRVLIVDDTLINRKILDRMMRTIGFPKDKLALVGSGQAALEELYRERYDLVITDLQMPGMNGMELSEAILARRQRDEFFSVPVLVGLTADTCSKVVEGCLASGMSDVIHKPITVEELRDFFERRISVLIDQNQSESMALGP